MKKILSDGINDFKDIIEQDCYYVDKTSVIEELLTKQKMGTFLFSRPRRFGKSLFISMLDNFFNIEKKEENKNLFKGLAVSKSNIFKENLNNYPVINLDFKTIKASTFEETLDGLKALMSELYLSKDYILKVLKSPEKDIFKSIAKKNSTDFDLKKSLYYLSVWLERYYDKKVIILIDEYDVPMDSGYNNRFYERIMEIIQPMFSNALKGNSSLKLGILTGVLRIGGESLFSSLNNIKIYDVMSSGYNEYFGFTEKETKELLGHFGVTYTNEVKEYYDGYNFNGTHIFNPWSILKYAEEKELRPFWVNTGENALIRYLLTDLNPEDKIKIENLLLDIPIAVDYQPKLSYRNLNSRNFNGILNLMIISGYLTLDYKDDNYTYFRIPNKEVKEDLGTILEEIEFGGSIKSSEETRIFIDSLLGGKKERAEEMLNKLLTNVSYNDNKEAFYHGYVLSIFNSFLNPKIYEVNSNRESGYGRADLLISKKDKSVGIVIELKNSKTMKDIEKVAEEGIEQLKERNYRMEMEKSKLKDIHEYVIVFHGKKAVVRER